MLHIISQQKDTPFDFSLSSKLPICFHGMFTQIRKKVMA